MSTRTVITLENKRYTVVHDEQGVIRIEYTHAIRGTQNLDQTGRTARAVLQEFDAQRDRTEGS